MRLTSVALSGLLLFSMTLVGCGGGNGSGEYKEPKKGQDVHTEKEPDAPHGGHILHGEPHHAVHLELTFDEDDRTVTVHVIASKEGKWEPHALEDEMVELHFEPDDADEPIEVMLKAVRAEGAETASEFAASGDDVPEGIEDIEDIVGHLHLTLDGKDVGFNIDHDHAHDH